MRNKDRSKVNGNAVLTETLPCHLLMKHNRMQAVNIDINYLNMTNLVTKPLVSIWYK